MSFRSAAAIAVVALLATGCARTRVTWRGDVEAAPLAADAPVRLYYRQGLAEALRDALAERGAEPVVAFPDGERVAEIEALDSIWLTWGTVLDAVRERARREGANVAVATGGTRGPLGDGVLLFQLLVD